MEVKSIRKWFTDKSTISDVYVDGEKFMLFLEDKDRGLTQSMTLDQIKSIKIPKLTAIPYGRYKLSLYYSPKHQRYVPLLVDVPGFDYVEIHPGNKPEDTDGCLLPGTERVHDWVTSSGAAYDRFFMRFSDAMNTSEECWIEISKMDIVA